MSDELLEIKRLIGEQGNAWDEFKKKNDEILAAKADGAAVSTLQEALDRINNDLNTKSAALDEMQKQLARRSLTDSEGKSLTPEQAEHKEALANYLRKGDASGLPDLERKALSRTSDPDGGFLLSSDMESMIDRVVSTTSAMRRISNVRPIGGAEYKKYTKTRGISGGWIADGATSSESTEQKWSEIIIKPETAYAEPWAPNNLLEDFEYDLEADITGEAGITFSEVEGSAFINGDGVGKPRGFLDYTKVANANYAWGKLGYIASGAAGAFASSNPADKLISLQHALKSSFRPGAVFLMNDTTLATVRQMKDGSGNYYLWNPDPAAGFGGRVLGSPVEIDDNMPDISANSFSLAFGNFRRGFTIVDRRGIAVIRDSITKKGVTKFYFSKRVGSGITNYEAIKLMKFATS